MTLDRTRRVIAILANGGDPAAHALAALWPPERTRLLTPATLARWRWAWRMAPDGAVDGHEMEVAGVISLMDAVRPADLIHIAPPERAYVAAEMTACLSAWLHTLPCPKLGPPSLGSLCGELHPVLWRAHAARSGMGLADWDAAEQPAPPDPATLAVTIVGDQAFGCDDPRAVERAHALAATARLPMLTVTMAQSDTGVVFREATVRPDLVNPEIAAAAVAWINERAT